ncbi:MAG: GAF domain-containing protein, partial [Anaerolineae bacterium]|nr:GAF domain-containing protein [Anaerolineae bacterium]
AQALYNARQYVAANEAFQRNAERLMTLAVLSRSLSSSVDVNSMCGQVLDEMMVATGAGTGLLVLLDDFASTPQIGAIRGLPDDREQYAEVMVALQRIDPASGAYVVRRDTHSIGLPPFLTENAQSMLIVPMIQSSFLFGAIWLESVSTDVFDSEDIRFVEQISNQAVIALENARLFQRLEGDRERLARLLDTMVEGIMMIDRQGDVVLANPRMTIVELPADNLLNTNFLALLEDTRLNFAERVGFASQEEAADFVIHMEDHLNEPEVKSYTLENGSADRYVERKIVPVSSGDKVLGLMLVFYDRSDQKELERSREELTNMIVHDLRSPLTAVTTSLRLLHDMIPHNSPYWPVVESTTEVSRRAVKKILNRVNSLLDIAKLQTGGLSVTRESIPFKRLIDAVVEELQPLAREMQIELVITGDGESPTLSVDIDKTERVLLNFVDNALKYSPMNTRVTIRYHKPEVTEGGAFVRVDVCDQGPGIPNEYKARLFDSFVQVQGRRSSRGGVGLGLTFAKLTVEAHGGRVWIEDNQGGGSVFAFTLPVV